MNWAIEKLKSEHRREQFDCGKELLNNFIKFLATQYREKNLGQTYVSASDDKRVVGYYTLSTSRVDFQNVPDALKRRFPQIPIPVVLLGRLAVDQTAQGQGLGKTLLVHALSQSAQFSERIGVAAVEVHALDDQARGFYLKYGFTELNDDRYHLYLSIKTIKKMVRS